MTERDAGQRLADVGAFVDMLERQTHVGIRIGPWAIGESILRLIAITREYQRSHTFAMREWEHDAKRANAAEAERDELRAHIRTLEDDIGITSCGTCHRAIVCIDQGLASCPWCERDALRERLAKLESCVVCGARLLPSDSPPRCDGSCEVSDEHEAE
jgi:hypothetical protein